VTKYYVSNAGSDTNDGLSELTPWATTAQVSSTSFLPGDVVAFRRGDTFYGSLTIRGTRTQSQQKVTVGAYGTGALPKLSMYKIINPSAWQLFATNIWRVDLTNTANYVGNPDTTSQYAVNVGFLRVNGVINPVKRWATSTLANQWDFYSDEAQYLYVYSTANPGTLATELCASTGRRLLSNSPTDGNGVRYTSIEALGCAGNFYDTTHTDVQIYGCVIHELGGAELIGYPQTRFGNAVEAWNGSMRVEAVGNIIYDCYDTATTVQGTYATSSTGWTDVWFRNNIIARCGQSFEVWGTLNGGPATPGVGFVRCGFENNICINSGYCWSAAVRPDPATLSHLLTHGIDVPSCDITITGNKFYGSPNYLIASDGGTTIPAGYNVTNNYVFLKHGQRIYSNMPYTIEQFSQFTAATGVGAGCVTEYINEGPASNTENILQMLVNFSSANTAESIIGQNSISELFGALNELRGEVGGLLYAAATPGASIPAPVTSVQAPSPDAPGYAEVVQFAISNQNYRVDSVFTFKLGGDSNPADRSVGIVNLQIVPGPGMTPGTTYVELDVAMVFPFRAAGTQSEQFYESDWVAVVTAETGTEVVVSLYFNVGKKAYTTLAVQPLIVLINQAYVTATYYNATPLLSVLPSGTAYTGSNSAVSWQFKSLTGSGAPTVTPSYVGQVYLDTTNDIQYIAYNTASVSGWVSTASPSPVEYPFQGENRVRNSIGVGAVVGSPGTLPTNWTTSSGGLTAAVHATGNEYGIPYVDLQLTGTATGTSWSVSFEAISATAALNGQTWTVSAFTKLISGSLSGITPYLLINSYSSGSGYLTSNSAGFTPNPSSAALTNSRITNTATLSNASTAYIAPVYQLNFTVGTVVSCILRIAMPQLEPRAQAGYPIGTAGTAMTLGSGLRVPEGSNAKQGVATLVAGTVVVPNTSVTAVSRIFLTAQDNNTNGEVKVSARTPGTSFTILSTNSSDTGVIAYEIFEPA
jgi:hypothetical protein